MRRPTILFMNRVYPPVHGATGRVLRDLARSFAREGWHVTIISSGPKAGEERMDGVRIIRVKGPEKPRGYLIYIWVWLKMMYVALRLRSRHLLVTMSDPPLIVVAGRIISKIKKSRHINWCHDLYPDIMPALGSKMPNFLMKWFKSISRNAMKTCDKVIVSGRCMAKHLALDGLDARKIAMVPNWPDIELCDPETMDEKEWAKATPIKEPKVKGARPFKKQHKADQSFRVLYAGNIGLAHPMDTIIDAAAILDDQKQDVEFVFVGGGERFDLLADQRSERRIDNIRLLPYQPLARLREVMEGGDIHLISMKEEAAGFLVPSKLYAALAVARPCILVGPEQSETAKVIHDFKTGAVVRQGDAQKLVDTILEFKNNREKWLAAHHGAQQARDIFTPHDSIEAWMERAWDIIKDDLSA